MKIHINQTPQPINFLDAPMIENSRAPKNLFFIHQCNNLLNEVLQLHHFHAIREEAPEATLAELSLLKTPLTNDDWKFGWAWSQIVHDFSTIESLYDAIRDRRNQIFEIKESWRVYIEAMKRLDAFYAHLSEISTDLSTRGIYQFSKDRLALIADGISGSYLLFDVDGMPRYVVKPIDEDIGCLNNRKHFASPYIENIIREYIPLYLSAMRETLAYEVARHIGVGGVVPHTALAILECDAFYDQLDGIHPSERERYESLIGSLPIREKLCSVQEFVPNSKTLFEGLQDLQSLGLSNDEIEQRIDQSDFEDANILLWTTFDTDGHMGNFLVYPKSSDAIGNEILGIKKIDNGLAFPEENTQLRNNLVYLPNARQPLSKAALAKIEALSIASLENALMQFGLDGSIEAMKERLTFLKDLVKEHPDLSIQEINRRMSHIARRGQE